MGICDTVMDYSSGVLNKSKDFLYNGDPNDTLATLVPQVRALRKQDPEWAAGLRDSWKHASGHVFMSGMVNLGNIVVTGGLSNGAVYHASQGEFGIAAAYALGAVMANKGFANVAMENTLSTQVRGADGARKDAARLERLGNYS